MRMLLGIPIVTVCLAFLLFGSQLDGPELEPAKASDAPPQNAATISDTSLMAPMGGQALSQRVTVPPSDDLETTSASETDSEKVGEPSTKQTQVYWKDQFEEKYIGYSPSEIDTKRRAVWNAYDVAMREHGREYIDRGDYIEADNASSLAPHLKPQSSVPGEGMIEMPFSVLQDDGTIRYRWVFIQPSSRPEEIKSLCLESTFLAMRAREMGISPDGSVR